MLSWTRRKRDGERSQFPFPFRWIGGQPRAAGDAFNSATPSSRSISRICRLTAEAAIFSYFAARWMGPERAT